MNIQKQAQRDAEEYARAQVFFGEGAGIRRRLIDHKVAGHMDDPKYAAAFDRALGKQDWADHTAAAVKERKRLDRGKSIHKNTRAVITGNRQNLDTGVFLLVSAALIAHKTGYDQKIYEAGKKKYQDLKRQYQAKRTLKKMNIHVVK
jgi:hypothetical protein